ncbi:hypothetical protein [Parapedobacter soli]|uniref:hypothetical protein n=1 Tax=Parapedobacter soli TaxID=416955 RepID=UPI0021C60CD9|nr:hypothetical protein [Parapedobacter soli]
MKYGHLDLGALGKILIVIISCLVVLTSLSSCEKEAIAADKLTEIPAEDTEGTIKTPTDTEQDTTEADEPEQEPTSSIILSGDANGRLIIDGNNEKYDCHTPIAIKRGIYTNIQIKNLKGQKGCPIQITNDGLVEVVGLRNHMLISDVAYVDIRGNGNSGIEHGFLFRDNEFRAIILDGTIDDIGITHIEFKNIGDYVISYNNKTPYDGSPDSYSNNISFSYLKANNTGALIHFSGGISGSTIQGLVKNLEISHVTYRNAPKAKNVVNIGMVVDYHVHHNVFQNINMENDDHNAVFLLNGNGRFYNNYISDHQGNALRAWSVSVGNTPMETQIYNNIVVNSRKYSAFEVQSFESSMIAGKTTFTNIKIFNNTCGNLNLSRDWYGVVVDAYRLFGGTCQVFNNLAFNLPTPHPESNFVSYMSIAKDALTLSNNLYFSTSKEAGIIDEKELKLNSTSKAKGQGRGTTLVTYDFYNQSRNTRSPSVGAVE